MEFESDTAKIIDIDKKKESAIAGAGRGRYIRIICLIIIIILLILRIIQINHSIAPRPYELSDSEISKIITQSQKDILPRNLEEDYKMNWNFQDIDDSILNQDHGSSSQTLTKNVDDKETQTSKIGYRKKRKATRLGFIGSPLK